MHIIIAGAGEVGFHVAKMLASEEHDIVLIDREESRLNFAEAHIDVRVIRGNSMSVSILRNAGVKKASLIIAATSSEETNMTTAIIAKRMGAQRAIVRISNTEFQEYESDLSLKDLGIDSMVFPEDLAAREIERLIQHSGLTDAFEFGNGKLMLTGLILENEAPLVGKNLIEVAAEYQDLEFTVVVVQRMGKTIIPRGDTDFQPNDRVYFISKPGEVPNLQKLGGKTRVEVRKVMILGASRIGRLFARQVQGHLQAKLVDKDADKCFDLADELAQVRVINGDGTNVELLEEEGIAEMDAFIAVTQDSETNIISCLVAKNHGVSRTVALVENIDYIALSHNIGIDTLINKKMIAVNEIFRHVREGKVENLTRLHGVDSELLEFVAHQSCKIIDQPIKKLHFPRDAVIAGIIRGEDSFSASGETVIQNGDRVVVFTLPKAVHKVEEFFK